MQENKIKNGAGPESGLQLSFGIAAMITATMALLIAVAHLSLGPFEQSEPVEQTIVDTAIKIKDAAKRAVSGEPAPAPTPAPDEQGVAWDMVTAIAILALAAAAMLLSVVGLIRREASTPVWVGFSLGAGVLLMTWLQWIALLICGAIILVAIINNLDSILS